MARGDKPYRLYRGGRVKGKVPTLPRPEPSRRRRRPRARAPLAPAPDQEQRRRRFGWGRRIGLAVGLLFLLLVAWGIASYLAFGDGVEAANGRLEPEARAALTPQDALLLSTPTTIALFGTDHNANVDARSGARRADSIMLVRTEPRTGRIAYLSVPRDLRVDVPGHGTNKVNAAFQLGGTALALETLREFTGLPIHHVAVVDFADFEELIDTLGGIEVTVPRPILSNRFDCPYATAERCAAWRGWRFERGKQTMNGRRALVYSRIRENRLDRSESDVSRAERQQQVLQALSSKLTSPLTLAKMPFIGDDVLRPLATDLTAWQFVQLGWRRFRSPTSSALHCRLGGTPSSIGGQAFLLPTEENRNVVAMFTGAAAPQPPAPGSGLFGPGCVVGSRSLARRR
jgi:polyisoprenyl-teichoic acid--peptidoglycan teichoic acid transferase